MIQEKYDIVVADTSCLIFFHKFVGFELLRMIFNSISVTKIIADEFLFELPEWIEVVDNSNNKVIQVLRLEVDLGEASAIALCLDSENSLLIIDDLKGRKLAQQLDLNFVGSIGTILKAKELNLINDLKPIKEKIQKSNFRLSEEILNLLN
jgi:predicted nucleic acid-binding protein